VRLPSVLQRLVRFPPRFRPRREELSAAVVLAGLVAIEVFARRNTSDFEDAAAVASLTLLAGFAWRRWGRVARVEGWRRSLRERLGALRLRIGLDLRGEPPLPRRWPRPYLALAIAVPLGAAALVAWRAVLPSAALETVRGVSGLAAIVLLGSLWGALASGTFVAFFAPALLLGALLERWSPAGRDAAARHRDVLRLWLGTFYLVLLALAAVLLPPWLPFVLLAATALFHWAVLLPPARPALTLAWKLGPKSTEAATLPGPVWMVGESLLLAGGITLLSVAALGERLDGSGGVARAITGFLGSAFLWSSVGAYAVYYVHGGVHVLRARLSNPARPMRPLVRVVSVAPGADEGLERLAGERLREAGFRVVRGPAGLGPLAAEIELAAEPRVGRPPGTWPVGLTARDLEDPECHHRLRRRNEVLARRRLRSGLKRLFKIAAARRRERDGSGSGFWIGPHLWFVTHLSRDSSGEDALGTIGPAYHTVIERAARHHLWTVLGALEVDLIFLEDGVGFRRFQRVLSMLFEHHDIFAGRRPLEERHFAGLPGVRVLLHDFALDRPLDSARYPEPDYEDLGRARILHVFRDRGEEEESPVDPVELDRVPAGGAPVLVS